MLRRIIPVVLFITVFISSIFSSSTEDIQSKIRRILDAIPASTEIAILIFNPLTEDTIYSVNHTRSMIPASNTKLFTTATALKIMGRDFPLHTKILMDNNSLTDSIITGNVYIKGLGNSVFSSEDLDSLVSEIAKNGITKITGDVIGDDTYFDDVYTRDDWINDENANVKLPPVSALVVDRNTKYVRKKRRGRWRTYKIHVTNPPKSAAQILKQKLVEMGINVEGVAKTGETPITATLLVQSSVVLNKLIQLINKNSDNFLAECLFKTIGAIASGKQGNSFYSTQAILTFIKDNAIYSENTSIVDGSGISRFDQITVGAIVGLLEIMYFDLKNFPDFYNSLSIAGVDGTLEERFDKAEIPINFRGKTGTLNGVSSLSGYLTTKSGDELIVSIIFEFKRGGSKKYRDAQDKIIEILNDWNEENPEEIDLQGFK
jgi:D-alanyl-D-alanine carboxypeptidase/D-alanyl-D-alanine-endopeptidase (penicillin-binding protein 4)